MPSWSVWSPRISVRINNAFGLTAKATDWAPELGIVFRFPGRG